MENKSVTYESPSSGSRKSIGRRLDAAGWGLFFIWVGVSLLMDLSWGIGLVGVAAIIVLKQTARVFFGRRLELFWVVVGALFLLGGIWDLYEIQTSLVPILLILVGGVFLLGLLRRRWDTSWCNCWGFSGVDGHTSRRRTNAESRSFDCCGSR